MTDMKKALLIYLAIWLVCAALAATGTAVLGLDARIPVDIAADGTVTKSRSVVLLWTMPLMLGFMYGAMAIAGWVQTLRRRGSTVLLGEDALRGLELYGRTVRNYMIGFGLLGLLIQGFTLLRAIGVVAPLGLGREGAVRVFFVITGLLFAYAGNVTPKLPYVRNEIVDAARHYRTNRFVGWVFMLGGIAYALSALLLPLERVMQAAGLLIAAMLLLPVVRYGLAVWSYRRQKRWERQEGLV